MHLLSVFKGTVGGPDENTKQEKNKTKQQQPRVIWLYLIFYTNDI